MFSQKSIVFVATSKFYSKQGDTIANQNFKTVPCAPISQTIFIVWLCPACCLTQKFTYTASQKMLPFFSWLTLSKMVRFNNFWYITSSWYLTLGYKFVHLIWKLWPHYRVKWKRHFQQYYLHMLLIIYTITEYNRFQLWQLQLKLQLFTYLQSKQSVLVDFAIFITHHWLIKTYVRLTYASYKL